MCEGEVWVLRLPDEPNERKYVLGEVRKSEPDVQDFPDTSSVGSLLKGRTQSGKAVALLGGCRPAIAD